MSSLKEFDHLRIALIEIVNATNNFSNENIIGEGRSAKVYKGQLLRSEELINVAVRRLDVNSGLGQGNVEFFTEISFLSHLKHANLNSIIGFCDENGEKIIVKEHVVNGSLERYLNSSTFTWLQRLQICVGAACALIYLHYYAGSNYGIIHRNIKSSKILVDEKWYAKVSGFELSLVIPERRTHRLLLSPTIDTSGYVDPVSIKSGSVTYKSDSYSLGMVLFEVICGRLWMIETDDDEQRLLAPLVKLKYDEGKLEEMIPLYLRKQMNQESLNLVAETAYYCLKEQRTQRPDMKQIVTNLFKAYKLQLKQENQVHKMVAVHSSPDHLEEKFKHMKIPLEKIMSATGNFDESNCIGKGGFGQVYKAELEWFDNKVQGVDQDVVRKTFTVAIKRILDRQDGQGKRGFLTEIEMLTSCEHPNVVSLLGFCNEGQERILIYEYASKGSLDDHLGSIDKMTNHTWMERLQMCLDIAQGLNYLHTKDKERIIHRDIKSANILLDDNWKPKIADFGLSKLIPMGQLKSYQETNVAGTNVYIDPEYVNTRRLKKESDVYSFGVVLFEILCGRLAYDKIYYRNNFKGLPSIARLCFIDKTVKNIIDPKVMEETDENMFTLNKGPNEESLNTFLKIANQCLEETQVKRPTMEVVIKDLQKALDSQVNRVDIYKISQEHLLLATENFCEKNLIGKGAFGDVYKGEVLQGHPVAVKRHVADRGQGEYEFLRELEVLFEYKHENVIGLVGYHNEMGERIIVYEHACHGSVDKYLSNASLTWQKRIKICIDVASGLSFLHGDVGSQERVIHRDIKSSNILLSDNWQAKISDFGLSMITPVNHNMNHVFCNPVGTPGYVDPIYITTGSLTKECDIFSLGVFLIEIMCGRLVMSFSKNGELQSLVDNLFEPSFREGKVDEIVFDGIKGKIVPESLILFSKTVHQCLHNERKERPTADQVIKQLEEALNIQEDYDMWEPKLPRDYKDLIQMSKSPEIYPTENKKHLYDMLSTGILLQNDKVWFSLSADGMRNAMISATMFSYKNQKSCKWSSTQNIRFPVVAHMLDISDMNIEVNITPRYLSPNILYGVYVVFKFCDPRKLSSKPAVYVNLKYKIRNKTLHSYFATWRDSEWMMLELDTFLNLKETTEFKVLLESFSQYCCGSSAIFVEGIEFRAIHVKDGGIENLKKVQPLSIDNDEVINKTKECDEGEKYLPRGVNEKKCHMLPAKMVLYDYSNVKCFSWIPLAESRFVEVAKLLAHEVFRIKCKIDLQSLSSDTDYACYLVFKLSEECHGLQCPVKVRDELLRKNKETKVIYFKSPSSLSVHSTKSVAEHRKDGLMEVIVWEFNSSNEHINHHLPMNLKLRCYEGTMSGLIVCGIEFRPIRCV